MSRPPPRDELKEMAAFYALGILSQEEAFVFDKHLADGCEACRTELFSYATVVSNLALAAGEVAPPPGLRQELMTRLARNDRDCFLTVYSGEGDWKPIMEGVLVKPLSVDKATGNVTSLVRMLPGTHLPRHMHEGDEQFFILEGDCYVHGDRLGPGDYHKAEAGSTHESTYTEGGTLFLLVAPESFRILDSA